MLFRAFSITCILTSFSFILPQNVMADRCTTLNKKKTKVVRGIDKIPDRITKAQTKTANKNGRVESKALAKIQEFQTAYSNATDYCNDPNRHPTCWDIQDPICMQSCPPGPPPTSAECGQMSGWEPNFAYCHNVCTPNRLVDIQATQCAYLDPLEENISDAQAKLASVQAQSTARNEKTARKVARLESKLVKKQNKLIQIEQALVTHQCT